MSSDTQTEDEFITSSFDLWEKRETDGGLQYVRNGIPVSEEAYQAAQASSLPEDECVTPYSVVDDFSREEIDEFAERPEDLSQEELEALKDVRAAYTVRHAYENTDFYRELFDDNGIDPYEIEGVEDLDQLPVIDGDDILENQPPATRGFRFENTDAQVRRVLNSSGSTDQPKEFKKSFDEMDRIAEDAARWLDEYGAGEGDWVVNYFPFVGLNASGIEMEGAIEEAGSASAPITNTPYPVEVEANKLKMYSPEGEDNNYVMAGLASHIDAKGKEFEREGFDPEEFGVDLILLSGEPVSDARKDNIAETYGAEVYEFLGTSESGGFAFECRDESDRLHVFDDSVLARILDPETGEEVPEDKEGSLNITNLLHPGEESAMPLISYDVGDWTTESESGYCSCDNDVGTDIRPPHREGWKFTAGAVNLEPTSLGDEVYDHPELKDLAQDYQVVVDYDEEKGQDSLQIKVDVLDDEIRGSAAVLTQEEGRVVADSQNNEILEDLGRQILESREKLRDTVSMGGARLELEATEIDDGKGKTQRLIDKRR